jgi:serine/threonine protein kinase
MVAMAVQPLASGASRPQSDGDAPSCLAPAPPFHTARDSQLPEHRIAEARGFILEEPLGSGHFGRVYRGRDKRTGQLVAVKVIDLLPSQQRQLALACRECCMMAGVQHECIVRVATFYAAEVQQRQRIVEPM